MFDLDEYTGSIIADLFGEDSYFADRKAFWALQNTAIATAKESYLAKGWAEFILLEVGEVFSSWEYVDTSKEDGGKIYVHKAGMSAECGFEHGAAKVDVSRTSLS